jgi:hypothetical protein
MSSKKQIGPKFGTIPKGKRGGIFRTKSGQLRVRWTQETVDKSLKLKHIFKGWF